MKRLLWIKKHALLHMFHQEAPPPVQLVPHIKMMIDYLFKLKINKGHMTLFTK